MAQNALKPQQVWAIRFWLDQHRRLRDRALFDFAIDSNIREGIKLRLAYRAESGETATRTMWPVTLGYADGKRVLIAWCEMREGFRDFHTNHMHMAELLDQPIEVGGAESRRRWQAWRGKELEGEAPFLR